MNSRSQMQPYLNNSLAIRHEITRFESVHPSIYAIYDLIELIPDQNVAQQIRDHVVCIEDSFVNSQEWTLSRSVPDLRLGILGSLSSGKSALVHRYLTGSYMQEESPEGGRFKKEIMVDNSSYLLLIRDEGGPPELQFTAWVDAVIFVFSLEDESSFNAIYSYYTKMSHYRNPAEIPIILVGTQDAISENNPRVIDDARARKLASDLKRCSYYETCATYGLNVERVFQDACQKIVQQRHFQPATCITPSNSRPSTPSGNYAPIAPPRPHHINQVTLNSTPSPNGISSSPHSPIHHSNTLSHKESQVKHYTLSSHHIQEKYPQLILQENNNIPKFSSSNFDNQITNCETGRGEGLQVPSKTETLPTPNATPTTTRKTRRRSNLFTPSRKGQNDVKNGGELGSGRAIPLKQGYLYKRSGKALNKDWKKKYVTLCDDGRLTYHPSLHDYMDDSHGKEISLQYVTVKVPGQKPRGSKSIITVAGGPTNGSTSLSEGLGGLSLSGYNCKDSKRVTDRVLLSALDVLKEPGAMRLASQASGDETSTINGDKIETPNVKKRHRRMKSSGIKSGEYDDGDGYEFYIVSLDNKQWHFEAANCEERDDWVSAIEQQILTSLQSNESSKKSSNNTAEQASIQSIRARVAGNTTCVDCDAPNPDWASLNLGILMCIECSGIHRNLGSHISRVRSLDLDEWPPGHLSVMLAIGNQLANSVWEANVHSLPKPLPNSSREEKERYIRAKYENKEFLPPMASHAPGGGATALGPAQQLVDAVCRSDIKQIVTILAHGGPEVVNGTVSRTDLRTPLHLACAMGNLAVAQLLIWNNANISSLDHEKRTCLAYARAAANLALAGKPQTSNAETARGLVELLLSHGCPESSTNGLGTLSRRRPSIGNNRKDQIPNSVV